ncbi:MAG TPA: TauD/TfdA family dioxygenase [Pyrinomonadaceae bacterium]|nr:TauD/TfdA family dioxygenase [Pyrinomonadaceae bacterium]
MIKTGLVNPERTLPFLVEFESDNGPAEQGQLTTWYKENEAFVDEMLLKHGAILFRGFRINTPSAFARLTRSIAPPGLLDCLDDNGPRTKITSGIYTSTEYPAEYFLSLHSEYAYSHIYPARLFFCCVVEPGKGGETPVADNRKILGQLDPQVVEEFARKKIKYVRNLHGGGSGFGLSWQATFQTTDKAVVEKYCRDRLIDYEWKADGGLRLENTCPCIITHPRTGEQVWFNQAPQFHPSDYNTDIFESLSESYRGREHDLPQTSFFGDDTPLDVGALKHIRETMFKQATVFPWQEGDVMMVDNVLACHGRMPFSGQRKILLAMADN